MNEHPAQPGEPKRPEQMQLEGRDNSPNIVERLWAALGGTVHVPDGVDLTEPIWDAETHDER